MNRTRYVSLAAALAVTAGYVTPAYAVTSARVVIKQDQREVPESRIQLFDVATGAEVRKQDDDDGEGALFLLDGGRYRVVIDGQPVREIAVTGTGSERFDIDLPPSAPRAAPAAPLEHDPVGIEILIAIFTGDFDIPETGIGVQRDGPSGTAPERDAGLSETPIRMLGGTIRSRFVTDGGITFDTAISFGEGDGENSFSIPGDSGIDSGRVNGAPAPSGSSGIITPFGLDGTTSVDVTRWGFKVDVGPSAPLPKARVYATFEYFNLDRDYRSALFYSGEGGGFIFEFTQDRAQALTEDYFVLGVGGVLQAPFSPTVIGHLGGSIGGYYRDSSLSSVERNTSNFGPSEDQDFTLTIEDQDDGFGFAGEALAGIEFKLSPRVSILAGGSARYLSEVGAIFNPNSGDQVFFDELTTALATDDSWSWQAGLGIKIGF